MILRQTWKGLMNLSQAPSNGKTNSKSYRTGFARACWAIGGVFIYFSYHYFLLSESEEGSEDNNGIYLLLIGALIAAGIGAFFAPRINAYLYRYTPQGRRSARSKKQLSSAKSKSQSDKRRDTSSEKSISRRHSQDSNLVSSNEVNKANTSAESNADKTSENSSNSNRSSRSSASKRSSSQTKSSEGRSQSDSE
jgi:hypothetical protein